ncbi:hypothetical protein [Mucilaginibacter terrae]|uniref:hypothetical protein n=1 Tax=Mucilaginibacter terrae TaxID=1955052 RepID=UPI00289E001D|nr:hypothetical protein [Mucilaginibacter terrae]
MTKRTAKILTSFLLLLTFVTGQVILFAHTHKTETQSVKHYAQKDKSKIADDNCPICVQHGNVQLFLQHHHFHFFALSSSYEPVAFATIYQSIELLLSGNRGPPAV